MHTGQDRVAVCICEMVLMVFAVIVSSVLLARLAVIFLTYIFPPCLDFLLRQDELFGDVTLLLYMFWSFLASFLDF